MIDAAQKNGPLVIEGWVCQRCECEVYMVHACAEVVYCAKCGQRTASKVTRYTHPDLPD